MFIRSNEYYQNGIINKSALYSLLRSDGSIVINKTLMRAIGINEAIAYCELLSRYSYFETRDQLTDDGFFFNTIEDLEEATSLSGYQQRKAIISLEKTGLIKMEIRGLPAKRYFKILDNIEMLINLLSLNKKPEKPLNTSSEETKQQEVKKLDGNNTNPIILKNDNDNGVFSTEKDSFVNREVVNAMKTYMNDLYKQRTKKKHPVLKPEQYRRIYDSIASFVEENSLDYDGIVEVMICYFNNKALNTDWNINHFATEGIMQNRLYESGVI